MKLRSPGLIHKRVQLVVIEIVCRTALSIKYAFTIKFIQSYYCSLYQDRIDARNTTALHHLSKIFIGIDCRILCTIYKSWDFIKHDNIIAHQTSFFHSSCMLTGSACSHEWTEQYSFCGTVCACGIRYHAVWRSIWLYLDSTTWINSTWSLNSMYRILHPPHQTLTSARNLDFLTQCTD